MDTLYYISNNEQLEKKLVQYMEKIGFAFVPYMIKEVNNVNFLLVVEPFKLNNDYFHIHTIWKSFFEINGNYPSLKLLVTRFGKNSDNPNYIDLFDISNDLKNALSNAKSIQENWVVEKNYADIITRLEMFFKGHNSISLFQKLNYLQMSVKNIHYAINGTINRTFEEALEKIIPTSKKQCKGFVNRWNTYKKFFICSPFHQEEAAISKALEEVHPFFESEDPSASLFERVKCLENFKIIRENLIKMDHYVRPEIYR